MLTDFLSVRSAILLVFLTVFPSTSAAASDRCSLWLPMALGDIVRDARWAVGPQCFTLDLGRPGKLLLAVSTDVEARVAQPRLDVFECSDSAPSSVRVRDRWVSSWLGEITAAARVAVCIDSQDPAGHLGSFKLTSVFAEQLWAKDGHPDEDEPEPDGLIAGRLLTKDGHPDEDEPEPDGWVADQGLCRAAAIDDHSDLFRCATPLVPGEVLEAEIRNAWGDDQDVFALRLDELATVRVEIADAGAFHGTFYDRFGNRLLATEIVGPSGSRLYKTLVPGLYFLRVSAPLKTEGAYRLRIELR